MAHKAKGFFYVSLGILALAVAFHLGARSAGASYVPFNEQGIIAIVDVYGWGHCDVLLDNGELWEISNGDPWRVNTHQTLPLPLPASDIKFLGPGIVVSRSTNEVWLNGSAPSPWVSHGAPPPLATSVPSRGQSERSTWGRVKAEMGR